VLDLRFARFWQLASIAGLIIILTFALIPSDWLWQNKMSGWHIRDKWLHGITFAFLTFWFCGQYERAAYWRVVLGLVAFGVLIEVCQQALVYRSAETMDLVADIAGIAVGLVLSYAATGGWCLKLETLAGDYRG
jgi:hypothetical protein